MDVIKKINQPLSLVDRCLIIILREYDNVDIQQIVDYLHTIPKQICYSTVRSKLPYLRELKLATTMIRYVQKEFEDHSCHGSICESWVECDCDEQYILRKIFKITGEKNVSNEKYYYITIKSIGDILANQSIERRYYKGQKHVIVDLTDAKILIGKITIRQIKRNYPDISDHDFIEEKLEEPKIKEIKIWYYFLNRYSTNYKQKTDIINNILAAKLKCACQDCGKSINEDDAVIFIRPAIYVEAGLFLQCCKKCIEKHYKGCVICSRILETIDDGDDEWCSNCIG